ncbi:MAG: hypothetical protein M5U28_07690 [Sandaracinaceae bacterium]|nr:hypothetical protein [Sandaracinaceae bacterium]
MGDTWAQELGINFSESTLGRATAVSDRGQRALLGYNQRGDVTWTGRQMALISAPLGDFSGSPTLDASGRPGVDDDEDAPTPGEVEYDETVVYHRLAAFDHAGRPFAMIAVDPEALASMDPRASGRRAAGVQPAGAAAPSGRLPRLLPGGRELDRGRRLLVLGRDGCRSSSTASSTCATASSRR